MSRLWMITYDIEDDKNRRKVHGILKNYGVRVQYSIFECRLKDEELQELETKVTCFLEAADSLRWYPLCKWCRQKITWQGDGQPADDPAFFIA